MGYNTTVDTKYHDTSLDQVSVHLGMLVFVGVISKLLRQELIIFCYSLSLLLLLIISFLYYWMPFYTPGSTVPSSLILAMIIR